MIDGLIIELVFEQLEENIFLKYAIYVEATCLRTCTIAKFVIFLGKFCSLMAGAWPV